MITEIKETFHWCELFSKPLIHAYIKTHVKVFHNDNTLDAYRVVYSPNGKYDTTHYSSMSHNPNHPCGVNMYLYEICDNPNQDFSLLGKLLQFEEIPEDVLNAIIERVNTLYFENEE